MCEKGIFWIKWVSTDYEVLDSVLSMDLAKNVRKLDLEPQNLPDEIALGVYWFVSSDTRFQNPKVCPNTNSSFNLISHQFSF